MLMNHLDRAPLGDLPATLATLLCGSPGVRFRVILIARTRVELDSDRTAERLSAAGAGEVALAFAGELREALDRVEMRP